MKTLANKFSEDIGKARITAHSIEQFYDCPSKQDYRWIIKELKGEIVTQQKGQHTVVENYIEMHAIHTKMKRVIPIICKGPSYLFGTATESDLKTICLSVSELARSHRVIAHVVDVNILVINITRVERSENGQTLNKIIWSLANLDVKLGNITQALEKGVFQVGQYVQLYFQLGSVMQAVRRTVWQADSYVEHVQIQLYMLLLGHLSLPVLTQRSLKDHKSI